CNDRVAVANGLVVVDDVGELAARRLARIEDMLVPERHFGELQERKDLQAVRVVVREAEQFWIGIEGEHARQVVVQIRRRRPAGRSRAPSSLAIAVITRVSVGSTALGNAAMIWPSRPIRYLWKFQRGVSPSCWVAAHL